MKYFITFTVLLFNSVLLFGHGLEGAGVTAGSDFFLNNAGERIGISPDLNITLYFLNIGTNIQYQEHNEPSYNFYIGIGLINFVQLQYGTNFSDNRFRLRFILPIFKKFSEDDSFIGFSRIKWYKRINFQFHLERNFNDNNLSNLAVGISYLIL